jgi:hypothetical protein
MPPILAAAGTRVLTDGMGLVDTTADLGRGALPLAPGFLMALSYRTL